MNHVIRIVANDVRRLLIRFRLSRCGEQISNLVTSIATIWEGCHESWIDCRSPAVVIGFRHGRP